jgi:carboxypeptidase T
MPYLNLEEVETALTVATSVPYNAFTQLITLPNRTWENRRCHALRIANGSKLNRPAVYLLGGVHAREWGSSDILINFIEQLEKAYLNKTGLTFGNKSFSVSDIQTIVNTLDIIIFPQANPDGRNHSMAVDAMWRKNRRTHSPNSTTGGSPPGSCVGVDLNRNYDFLWDFRTYFDPSSPVSDSTDPCEYQVYHGPAAFSEPESKNVKWIFDSFPNICFFIDLHSYSEDILYSWGDDDDQTDDPNMNFQTPAFNGLRGIAGDSTYMEYIPSSDLSLAIDLANTFRDGIQSVRGTTYTVKPAVGLYPTAGTSDDYAYSRHFIDSTKEKVIAYTLEWGKEFQPPYKEMQNIIQEITSGLLTFCSWICSSPNLRLSRMENMVESLQSQIKQLRETRSLDIRRRTSPRRAKRRGNNNIKTKKKITRRKTKKK